MGNIKEQINKLQENITIYTEEIRHTNFLEIQEIADFGVLYWFLKMLFIYDKLNFKSIKVNFI